MPCPERVSKAIASSTRRALPAGTPGRQVTLFEVEALEALKKEHGIDLAPIETRRNVATRGVRLNDLLGHEFRVGEVSLRGVDLCHPCSHLEAMTRPGVLRGLVARGGLVAEILSEGTIHVGDTIE